ncbi:hypothetical protein K2173_027343 [Erythroxylum novogranatense]|uniref:EamA domain-containing protein n=1 Tax=Erythroxylum novogranatense TaxID=1862640 RepID=A0AAV8TYT3_9ROSI|nr:hypothetical protein K2173_027343 [Erythroxylum novogranatense]
MAYPSLPATWRTGSATATTRKDFPSGVSCSFISFSIITDSQRCKRSRLFIFSTDPASSSYSSCSTSHCTDLPYLKNKKRTSQSAKIIDGSSAINACCDDGSGVAFVAKDKAIVRRSGHIGLISKVEKRPFWRKFLFASEKIRSVLLLNVITVVYASNIPVVKAVEDMMDPAAFSAVRFVVSAIPFLPFVFRARDDAQTRNAGLELGLWVSLGYLIEAIGLLTSDAGRASFISLFTLLHSFPNLDGLENIINCNIKTNFTGLIGDCCTIGATIPVRTWFGVLMSAIGVAMLECSGSPPCVGDLLNFLSAIFFGIHMLRTEHISRNTKKENFLPLLGYEVCVVAFLSTMWVMIGGWFDEVELDQLSFTLPMVWDWIVTFPWIPALYTGVFSTGLCLWVEFAAMRDISATETAVIYGLEPLWGAGFAWFLLGERWGTAGWIGATLVLCGSLVVQIYGTSVNSMKAEDKKQEDVLVSEEQKLPRNLSASPVVVRSRKDVIDMLK